jgi:hypothetical protein
MKTTKIVYVLGAGFSAPLGLPLVGDFFDKSHVMHDEEPDQFAHFADVYKLVRELARAKNYFKTNLFNIEEILSLVEVRTRLAGEHGTSLIERYIRDVIQYYTPKISDSADDSFINKAFGGHLWAGHVAFTAGLLGLSMRKVEGPLPVQYQTFTTLNKYEYAVVSLNYDLVLENAAEFLNVSRGSKRGFVRSSSSNSETGFSGHLAKLHGSVDGGPLVPPTWSKSFATEGIASEWSHAARLLAEAHHIRVLGYSLPTADTYVRYLFRSAAIDSKYLRRFDVITLDGDQRTQSRYRKFVDFPGFKFESNRIETYLIRLLENHRAATDVLASEALEVVHRQLLQLMD